jgi:hypothetical protein
METEHTPGWEHYRALVEESIYYLEQEIKTMNTDGLRADEIGLRYTKLIERRDGLKQALGVAEDIKKETADDI